MQAKCFRQTIAVHLALVVGLALTGALVSLALVLPSIALAGSAPKDVTLPAVSGTLTVGKTLTTSNGTWTEEPTSYAYQWKKCTSEGTSCTNISGATASTYASIPEDAGKTMKAEVKATNAFGTGQATSKPGSTA